MPGNYSVIAIDKNRVCPSKFFDGRSDLSDLGFRMSSGIAGVRNGFQGDGTDTQDLVLLTQTCRPTIII